MDLIRSGVMAINFDLNGESVTFDGDPDTPLLWAIRDHFGLSAASRNAGPALCI